MTINTLFKKCNFEPNRIRNSLEGHYICVIKKAGQINVFGDSFNRRNLFYCEDGQTVYFDAKLIKGLIDRCDKKINRMNLFSYLMIGYGHATTTIFEGIHRLGYKEHLLFKENSYSIINEFEPSKIEKYGEQSQKDFEKLFTESISARMDEQGTNWLMASSGWDSTLILDTLLKLTEKNKINIATITHRIRDGRFHNIFEMQKLEEIARHYDLKINKFIVDMNDKKLVEKWKRCAPLCFESHVFQFPIHYFSIADYILKSDPKVGAIFNGDCSDSFQNFGFSQYISLHSGNMDFNEYADKMKTYLYGPTFFNEVKNGKSQDNMVYKIFKKMKENIDFHDENDYLKAMLSFIYSSTRFPFTLPKSLPIFEKEILEEFFVSASKNYFERYHKLLNSKNIYSIWNALYADFHFKGLSIPMCIYGIENAGLTAAFPFFDIRLSDFFAKMPEEWGRGLNLNTVKYPEKTMALKSRTYPIHIVNNKMPHSYISEEDPHINSNYEYYCNSTIGDYFREMLSEGNCLDYLKNVKGIDNDYIDKIRNDFLNENLSMSNLPVMTKICILTSMIKEHLPEIFERPLSVSL